MHYVIKQSCLSKLVLMLILIFFMGSCKNFSKKVKEKVGAVEDSLDHKKSDKKEEARFEDDDEKGTTEKNKEITSIGEEVGDEGEKDDTDIFADKERPIKIKCSEFEDGLRLTHKSGAEVDFIIESCGDIKTDLVIAPGVVIAMDKNTALRFTHGWLDAQGTSEKPIVIKGKNNKKRYWKGVYFDNNDGHNEMAYVEISDAGSDYDAALMVKGSYLNMSNSKITNSSGYGLYAWGGSSNLSFKDNVITGNDKSAKISSYLLGAFDSSNNFKGNDKDDILVESSTIVEPMTWPNVDVPYELGGSVTAHDLLTIEPGTEIKFSSNGLLFLAPRGSTIGGLKAVGTAEEPIIFTAQTEVKKAWKGIGFRNSKRPENEIAFVEMRYSGMDAPEANIYALSGESILNIHDVKFIDVDGCAINYKKDNSNITIGDNVESDSGCVTEE